MKTIWKFELEIVDDQSIKLPRDSKILAVQTQNDNPCIWVLVNPDNDKEKVHIRIIGTGHPIEDNFNGKHIGTFQVLNGSGIFHVFVV